MGAKPCVCGLAVYVGGKGAVGVGNSYIKKIELVVRFRFVRELDVGMLAVDIITKQFYLMFMLEYYKSVISISTII